MTAAKKSTAKRPAARPSTPKAPAEAPAAAAAPEPAPAAPKKLDRKAAVDKIRAAVEPLYEDVAADPGDGVLLHHLTALRSNLESLAQMEEYDRQQIRPEGE